ncbi:hypothetical protein HNY73_010317 [Argiope bruennichi]|uniref:Uncharacterized protein n=1 Tax=Argiope bruennichi TaxID=94029 RepID=A0A8T0F5J0_ARGBR|nr:hypothetical protein HNY73_010317 [Argiope bruennichi]
MSEGKPWIDPCGFNIDEISRKKIKISLKNHIPKIEEGIKNIIKRLTDLKKFMISTFNVNEETLISQQYKFLNPPQNIRNIYIRAYHILQVNVMALVQMLKEYDNEDDYSTKLENIKNHLRVLICELQPVLLSEGLKVEDVTEELMSEAFKNSRGSLMIVKHFVAIRQIDNNMKYLSDDFEKIQFISNEELRNEQPSI